MCWSIFFSKFVFFINYKFISLVKSSSSLNTDLLSILIPASLREFSLVSVSVSPSCIVLRLDESANNIPSALKDNPNIVLDGFCNPLELQASSARFRC